MEWSIAVYAKQKNLKLYYHPASSASMRVTLYLSCREIPEEIVRLVSTGVTTDHRGILVFTLPEDDPDTSILGTNDLTAFNPEGRIPILLLPNGRKMTQSGPIIDFIESQIGNTGRRLLPEDPWANAEVKRLMWIIAADIQPYQNIPFIIQAMSDWGMVKARPTEHPLRLHFIRREFGALEKIMENSAGNFSVGNDLSLADCFLVPQIRNALLAGIDLAQEFPTISKVFKNLLEVPNVSKVVEKSGGAIQPFAFDEEKFQVFHKTLDD